MYKFNKIVDKYIFTVHISSDVYVCIFFNRYFCKDMQISLDKKSNIEYLEKEFGLHKFLPKSVLEAIKPKVLKKAIQQQFKKVFIISYTYYEKK